MAMARRTRVGHEKRDDGESAGTPAIPNPEVEERPKRRQYSAEYKLRVLREVESAPEGGIGAVLRREGLYSSHINTWRRQREDGQLEGLTPKKRGPKTKRRNDPVAKENAKLRRETARLKQRLEQAEKIIEIQKKVSEIMGITLPTVEDDERNS